MPSATPSTRACARKTTFSATRTTRSTSIAYYVWVIKGAHGTFVVDTGFDEKAAKERGRKIIHPVGEGLEALGIKPDQVDHVIATHMHWDHAGNYDLFPNARYHIQDTEMAYCTGRCMCHQTLRIPFSEDDVHAMVRKVYAYRVEFHDGSERTGARHHRAQDRRPFEGAAMRAGEDQARLWWCSPPTAVTSIRTSTRAACSRSPTASAIRWRATGRC